MLKEVRFRYRHDACWLQETTERYPEVTLVISSVYLQEDDVHIDLMVHASAPDAVERAVEDWRKDPRIHRITKMYAGPRGTRFHVAYTKANSIYPDIIHHTPVSIGAIRMAAGTEHYAIVGESEDVTALMQTLSAEGDLDVESVRNLKEMPHEPEPAELASEASLLTDKQWEALALAHSQGYYRWPRELSASELAARIGLSSSAFLEHLRHAESRVLDRLVKQMKAADPARFDALKGRIERLDQAKRRSPGPRSRA